MKHLLSIPIFFIVLFLYSKWGPPLPLSVNQVTTTKSEAFTVTGTGKVTMAPDIAVTSLGVQAAGTTAKLAQEELNKNINAVSAAVKNLGVDQKDIKTANYSVQPTYDFTGGRQRITGYQASGNLSIKIRQMDKANDVIDAGTAAGANVVSGISFDVDDKVAAQNEGRKMAIADAKSKAENAANMAGFRLGKMINYQESFGGEPRPVYMLAKAEGAGIANDTATSIEPGSSEVNVSVTLSYEIQ